LNQPGLYAANSYDSFRVDGNCSLICGWAKFTERINGTNMPCRKPTPAMALIDVESIVNTCSGIEDSMNTILHSYIFVPSKKLA